MNKHYANHLSHLTSPGVISYSTAAPWVFEPIPNEISKITMLMEKMMLKGIFSSLLVCQSSWTQLESGTCYLFRLIATKVPKLKKQKRFASNTLWIFSWQKTLWCTEKSISQLCTYTLSETASLFFSPCVSLLALMTWLNHAVFQSLLNTVLPS